MSKISNTKKWITSQIPKILSSSAKAGCPQEQKTAEDTAETNPQSKTPPIQTGTHPNQATHREDPRLLKLQQKRPARNRRQRPERRVLPPQGRKKQQIELSEQQDSPVAFTKKQNEEFRPKQSAREAINIFNIESNQPSRQEGKANINFLYEDEEIIENKPKPPPIAIARNNNQAIFMHSSDSELSDGDPIVISQSKQYFNLSNRSTYKQQLTSMLKFNHQFKTSLQRDNSGFNTFWPEFKLVFKGEEMGILHAKRTTARPISTFIVSLSKTDFEQSSDNYMGKMKSNAMGDVLNIFTAGLNPKSAKEKSLKPRELLATIVYQTNMFQSGKPREFYVYIKKKQFDYYKDFKGVKLYEDEVPYNELFTHEENRNKLVLYQNKKPVWNEAIGGHMLNFRGRVSCASIKNFILQDPQGREAILFGKKDENDYTMQISDTISPYLAFCIALSAFDSKLICE